MGSRYSDIRRGAQLNQDLTNYVQYLQQPRTRNVGSGTPRDRQRVLFVTPFGQDIETDELVQVKAAADSYTALSTYLVTGNGAKVETVVGSNKVRDIARFRPARVVWFRNATRSVTVARSNVTNRQYLKYNGDSDSCPFGRALATDDLIDVFSAIKANIFTANASLIVNRVSLTREKISF